MLVWNGEVFDGLEVSGEKRWRVRKGGSGGCGAEGVRCWRVRWELIFSLVSDAGWAGRE